MRMIKKKNKKKVKKFLNWNRKEKYLRHNDIYIELKLDCFLSNDKENLIKGSVILFDKINFFLINLQLSKHFYLAFLFV